MDEELTIQDYLSLARTFAWVVNQSLVNGAGAAPSLGYKRLCNEVGDVVEFLDEAKSKLACLVEAGLHPPHPCHVGLPPCAALQKLAAIIVVQKGTGAVTIGSSSFTCEAAK